MSLATRRGLPRLSQSTLAEAHPTVARPVYDRSQVQIGIVHFGPGAFFRAHQTYYVDEVLRSDPRWGISAMSLRSPGVRDALQPQDGLYTLAQLDEHTAFRVIGSVKELLVAPEQPDAVFARLTAPETRVVTMTVTEKGYCLTGDGALDLSHPDIRHDLEHPERPASLIGWLAEGLRRRKTDSFAPFTVISCDNLVDNGVRLGRAVAAFARARGDAELAGWVDAEVRFPRTMVDSITPATDDALRARVAAELGLEDAWPIQREAFTQWVIERLPGMDGPDWSSVGVTLAEEVAPYERAKLRLLNGAHSTLAYAGLLAGHDTVGEAMRDPKLAGFVRALMIEDVAPTLRAPAGFDLQAYIDAVLHRFRNPEIRHNLAQIAWDGSQKLPFRILGTAADMLAAGRRVDRLAVPIAAWMAFVGKRAQDGVALVDPLADTLAEIGRACRGEPEPDVAMFLALDSVFPPQLSFDERFAGPVRRAYGLIVQKGVDAALA